MFVSGVHTTFLQSLFSVVCGFPPLVRSGWQAILNMLNIQFSLFIVSGHRNNFSLFILLLSPPAQFVLCLLNVCFVPSLMLCKYFLGRSSLSSLYLLLSGIMVFFTSSHFPLDLIFPRYLDAGLDLNAPHSS